MTCLMLPLTEEKLQEVILGCKQQDSRSQEILYKRYAQALYAVAKRYEHTRSEAQDILQDAFMSIFSNIHQFDPQKGKIKNWMIRIVINTALKSKEKKSIR